MAWRPSHYPILDGSACRGLMGRRSPGVRLNWYSQGPGYETRPVLAIGASTLFLTYPCLLLWLCSQVTLLAWLFLTLAWFDLRFGFVLSFWFSQRKPYQWLKPVHWSLTIGFGAKVPATVSVPLPHFILSIASLMTLQEGVDGGGKFGCSRSMAQFWTSHTVLNLQITVKIPLWQDLEYSPGTWWSWKFLVLLAPSPSKSRGTNYPVHTRVLNTARVLKNWSTRPWLLGTFPGFSTEHPKSQANRHSWSASVTSSQWPLGHTAILRVIKEVEHLTFSQE